MTDRASTRGAEAEMVRAAVAAGVDWVQVRERELLGAALLAHVEALTAAARKGAAERGGGVRVIVNRRTDVALAAGSDGVHLGFDAVDAQTARQLLGADAEIGISAHQPEEITRAPEALTYAHLAPIFDPISKPASRPELGIGTLRRAASAGLPVFAQGGVRAENVRALLEAGAAGVAVTGAIVAASDPAAAAARIRAALDR